MSYIPEEIQQIIDDLAELPSIGPRQATRLAFYILSLGPEVITGLARDIKKLENITHCKRCFFVHEKSSDLCPICSDDNRDHSTIAVVEKETDLLSLEKANQFNGRYLVLGPIPKTGGLQPQHELRLKQLKSFIKKELSGTADEIILAFDQTSTGDFHASLIEKALKGTAQKITRLGRGMPTGGEVEFADEETLGGALERRN